MYLPPNDSGPYHCAIKMHEVMELSLDKVLVKGVRYPDTRGIVGVLYLYQLLSVVSKSDGKQMFVSIKKTADRSGCTSSFPKKVWRGSQRLDQ